MHPGPTLYQRLAEDIKSAMRARDAARLACLRQVKARVQDAELTHGPWPATGPDDDRVRAIIVAYRKALTKGAAELAAGGERGRALQARYQAECDLLRAYLPPPFDDAALAAHAQTLAKEMGIDSRQGAGKLLGALIARHGELVEPAAARRVIATLLEPSAP